MGRELDGRDRSRTKNTPNRVKELKSRASETSDRLAGPHRLRLVRVDPLTGNAAVVASEMADAGTDNFVHRALNHVSLISSALGFAETQPVEFVPDPNVQKTSSGAVAVHLRQQYKGIPIFQASETVRFTPDGTLSETTGRVVTIDADLPVAPTLTVEEAVMKAAEHVAVPQEDEKDEKDPFGEPLPPLGVDLTGFESVVLATSEDDPALPTTLEAGPFDRKIVAKLTWFDLGDDLRLSWQVLTTMGDGEAQYRTVVDAETGAITYCRQLVDAAAARGNVYPVDGGGPREMVDFPRPLADYGLPTVGVTNFPRDWVETDKAIGNSANAHIEASGPTIRGTVQGGLLTFDPADEKGEDQQVLNIFYYNCYMHDFFYLLGFTEVVGNFQKSNLGLGGSQSDRVDARAYPGRVRGTATMLTPPDGFSPTMKMGLVTGTGRHTAFDSSVVFHEFMHGVTNRLVGGRTSAAALDEIQSGGMGEGWGDYIACSINESTVVGSWVVNDPTGIRKFPYDSSFPDNFGDIGTGRYDEVHNIGEIWCATLMEMNRKIGRVLGIQLVVDALMISPSNPSFLDMRDAIFTALDNKRAADQITEAQHRTNRRDIWEVFAKFGMGPAAASDGPTLSGIVADFQVPPDDSPDTNIVVDESPNVKIPDADPTGIARALQVDQTGRLTRLAVSIDIQHTWIGDLIVQVVSPAGTSAVLHNRAGGSGDNIVATFESDTFAPLSALLGETAKGDWTLRVSDHAGADEGKLKSWKLDMDIEPADAVVRVENSESMPIPDNKPAGVESKIAIGDAGTVKSIKVGVDISHTWIGDLEVRLRSPSGEEALLHNRAGGSTDNLNETWDSLSSPNLAPLLGATSDGEWELHIKDLARRDRGKLNGWFLEMTL